MKSYQTEMVLTEARYPAGGDWFTGRAYVPAGPAGAELLQGQKINKDIFDEQDGLPLVGSFVDAIEGLKYRIDWRYQVHPVFGAQAVILKNHEPIPIEDWHGSERAVLGLLGCIKRRLDERRREDELPRLGIGLRRLELLVEAHGKKSSLILAAEPERIAELPGWTAEAAQLYGAEAAVLNAELPAREELAELGKNGALTRRHIEKLIKAYGGAAAQAMREDPFRFIDMEGANGDKLLPGFAFGRAVKVALNAGIESTRPSFLAAAFVAVIKNKVEGEGDCWGRVKSVSHQVVEAIDRASNTGQEQRPYGLELSPGAANRALRGALKLWLEYSSSGLVYPSWEEGAVELAELANAEDAVAAWAVSAAKDGTGYEAHAADADFQKGLNGAQVEAFKIGVSSRLAILTGGPGRGKTHVCKAIIAGIKARGGRPIILAPTGRAAARAREVTGARAATIHSWIYKNRREQQTETHLIIDEASMVDARMAAWLAAAGSTRSVLLVGDPAQLPPIAAGRPFADLIESSVIPAVELVEVMRTDRRGLIVATDAIDAGRPELLRSIDCPSWRLLSSSKCEDVAAIVAELLTTQAPESIQVITGRNGYNRACQGLSSKSLNGMLQPLLNPCGRELKNVFASGEKVHAGDRLMQLKNRREVPTMGQAPVSLANGEIGTAKRVISKDRFLVDFGGRLCTVHKIDNDLRPAWAATCHKFQGSQAPNIIVVFGRESARLIDRSWVYTAVSRAELSCTVLAENATLRLACESEPKIRTRKSFLPERIRAEIAKSNRK